MRLVWGVCFLAVSAAPAAALEEEIESGVMMGYACRATFKDPPVALPVVFGRDGRRDESLTRSLRRRPALVAREKRRLELSAQKASCLTYAGGAEVYDAWRVLESSLTAAAQADAREFAALNLSFTVQWSTTPLSEAEKELDGPPAKPGPFAGVCRPPVVSTTVFVPSSGQAASEAEAAAYARLTQDARVVRDDVGRLRADFEPLLASLEGRACSELTRQFYRLVSERRNAFFRHRDAVLGRVLRDRLKWEPLAPAP